MNKVTIYEKNMNTNQSLFFNKINSKNNAIIESMIGLLAIIVIAWMNNGIFTYTIWFIPNYIRYAIYLTWFSLIIIRNKQYINKFIFKMWPLIFFLFYMLLMSVLTKNNLSGFIKGIIYLIIVYSIFLYYVDLRHKKIQKLLCIFLIFDCVIVGLNTYHQLKKNPMLARLLSTSLETQEELLGSTIYQGVANYGYFYALVSIILLLTYIYISEKRKKIILLPLIFLAIALLFKGAFTFAIIFTFIFLMLIFIKNISNKNKLLFTILLLMFITLFLLLRGVFSQLFIIFSEIGSIPEPVSFRFNEIGYFLKDFNIINNIAIYGRVDRYLQSIEAFLNNPFLGTIYNNSSIYKAGSHSAWLDLLATFGLFAILFFVFLYKAYKYGRKITPVNFRSFYNIYWLYFICLGFVNTLLFASIYTIWFLFLPLFINNSCGNNKKITFAWLGLFKKEVLIENTLSN